MAEINNNPGEKEVHLDIGLSNEDEARLKALNDTSPIGSDEVIASTGNVIVDIYNKINLYFQAMASVKTRDKVMFFELLSVMLNAGVPLIRSLYVLSDQTKNVKLKLITREMAKKVESGKKFSDAMASYSKVFTDAEIGMVRSGEATGKLNEVLKQIAMQAEKNASIMGKVKGAMIYPASIVCIMLGAVVVILVKVVPKITEIFDQSGVELPTSTKVLIWMSDIAKDHYIEALSVIIIFVVAFWLFKQTSTGKYMIDNALLRIPVFGEIFKKVALSRFSRNLSSLMKSGVAIVRALEINANAVGNEVYKKRILMAAEDVAQGIPLGENLNDSKFLFPDMVVSMITVGEQTAKVDEVADKIAEFYEEQVDETIKGLSKMLEPVILVVMGVTVGGLVAAVMQPIMDLTDVGKAL
ncbi:MAG: type II secretion system F family protein [Candidatus Gracilibacteria bacterium]|jgi:type IV pilus assembly protein PilC